MFILLCASIMTSVISSDAYVLLQVRKHDNNHSKVDALIHKVVPSDKFNEFASKIAGEQITIMNKPKTKEPTRDISKSGRATDFLNNESNTDEEKDLDGKRTDAALSLGKDDPKVLTLIAHQSEEINPRARARESGEINPRARASESGEINSRARASESGEINPRMRARGKVQVIEPKTIKFRTGESSLLYEVNTGTVVRAVDELLSSSSVRKYVDSLSKQAAIVYRLMSKK